MIYIERFVLNQQYFTHKTHKVDAGGLPLACFGAFSQKRALLFWGGILLFRNKIGCRQLY